MFVNFNSNDISCGNSKLLTSNQIIKLINYTYQKLMQNILNNTTLEILPLK